MNMHELRVILRPDKRPVALPTQDQFAFVEEQLGLRLPDDYKSFMAYYGRGNVARFLLLCAPFSQHSRADILVAAANDQEGYKTLQENYPEDFPYDRYPTNGGLLPWAYTINGDWLYWITTGEPEQWNVVVYSRGDWRLFRFQMGMLDFIGSLVLGTLESDVFKDVAPFEDGIYYADVA